MREIVELFQNRTIQLAGLAVAAMVALAMIISSPQPLVLSRWNELSGDARAIDGPQPVRPSVLTVGERPIGTPLTPGSVMLEGYNSNSTLIETTANGSIRLFRRSLARGGTLAYIVVMLDEQTHIEIINADGATPGSDASGDTIWLDRNRHRRTVEEMARADYSIRPGLTLLGAMAFGFHGEERTSNEGTVVINGKVLRVNPGRSTLCIRPDRTTAIGVLNAEQASECAQAIGAGPVVMLGGKIANPAIPAETNEFLPYNPLGEDFVQIDWRRTVFSGDYPKTMIGIGVHADGRHYLVMMTTYGLNGIEAGRQLRAMGCTDAIGGDDDSSTQLVWRGDQVTPRAVRAVPDAIGVYARAP